MPSLAIRNVKRGHGSVRGLRQCDRQLGALPRHRRPGDRDENFKPGPDSFPPIDAARDRNREWAHEPDCAARDLPQHRIFHFATCASRRQFYVHAVHMRYPEV